MNDAMGRTQSEFCLAAWSHGFNVDILLPMRSVMYVVALAVLNAISLPNPTVFDAMPFVRARHFRMNVVFLLIFSACSSILARNGSELSVPAITIDAPTDIATNNADIFIFADVVFVRFFTYFHFNLNVDLIQFDPVYFL